MKNNKQHETMLDTVVHTLRNAHVIQEMQISKEDKQTHIHTVFSLIGQKNTCDMICDEFLQPIEEHCDCHWMKDYGTCPHVKLAHEKMLEFKDETFPFTYRNPHHEYINHQLDTYQERLRLRILQNQADKAKDLLEEIRKTYDTKMHIQLQETKYDIEPVLSNKSMRWEVSFKIGSDKKYVIKSLPQFIKQIDEHSDVSYGKSLHFIHSEEILSDVALMQLRFLRKHVPKAQRISNTVFEQNLRSMPLRGNLLDELFELYENQDVPLNLEEDTFPIIICVDVENEYYIFHMEETIPLLYGEKHIYTIDADDKIPCLSRMKLDDEGISALFLKKLSMEEMVISKEDYPQFYKYVLLTVMNYVEIKVPMLENEEPMERAELYGDINEYGQLYFYMYCYTASNHRYFGFDKSRITSYQQDVIESYIRKYATSFDEEKHMIYMDENMESTIEFIREGLPYLSNLCDIYVSEALKSMGKSQTYHIQVGVRFSNNLLSLDINSEEIPKEELASVLQAYKRKKRFYRLKNGKLLSLISDELDELSTFMEDYHISHQDIQKGKATMEPYRMFALDQKAEDTKYIQIQREKTFTKYLDQYYHVQQYSIPNHYENILRSYQKEGFQWLSIMRQYNFNGILADDMGLGKTVQVIALLEANKHDVCSLVVCPSSLIYNWEDEVHKFSENLNVGCVTGTQEERKAKIEQYNQYDLLVTSYDYIRRDIDLYENIVFDTVILDEAQYIKNQKTKNAMSVKRLQSAHRLALTGTPIENSLAELWSIFDFLMPDYLFNYHYFKQHYENDIVKDGNAEKQEALRTLVSPFILRRNKKDVLKELPDKIEKVRLIEFSEEEQKLYLANLAQVNKELQEMLNVGTQDKIAILAMMTRLRQLCCEPRLLYENIDQLSSKLADCLQLIEELHENHQKVLLFSSFTSILDLLAQELKRKQISYYALTGSTNKELRRELVDKFQHDDTSVFLISLKAGGTGLNLTAAEAVIHFDPWWNQSAQNQATDRAYRIGQNKNVQVFKMIMKDSIEEKIMKMQEKKQELADAFVEHNEGSIAKMSKEEILDLFKM